MNWRKIIDEIRQASGYTDAEIGERTGVSQATINRLRHGQANEPMYSLGEKLQTLHAIVYRERRDRLTVGAKEAAGATIQGRPGPDDDTATIAPESV